MTISVLNISLGFQIKCLYEDDTPDFLVERIGMVNVIIWALMMYGVRYRASIKPVFSFNDLSFLIFFPSSIAN